MVFPHPPEQPVGLAHTATHRPLRILTVAEICRLLGISRSNFYRLRQQPGFPAAIELSPGRVGYWEHEIEAWLCSRPRRGGGGR